MGQQGKYRLDNPEKLHPRSSHGMVFSHVRPGQKVLELGPGPGTITRHLRRVCDLIVVVEMDPQFAAECRPYVEAVIQGDLESPGTWNHLEKLGHRYDVIVAADILEHLRDPWETLRRLRGLLAENGRIVASVPNVAHWSIRWSLLIGRFNYVDEGLLDRTHLRFFTLSSVKKLFTDSGFLTLGIGFTHSNNFFLPFRILLGIVPGLEPLLNLLFPNLMGFQFIIEAAPTPKIP